MLCIVVSVYKEMQLISSAVSGNFRQYGLEILMAVTVDASFGIVMLCFSLGTYKCFGRNPCLCL